jgi:hypothetical protein
LLPGIKSGCKSLVCKRTQRGLAGMPPSACLLRSYSLLETKIQWSVQLSGGSSEWGADAADDDAVMLGTMSTARTMPRAPPGEGAGRKLVSFGAILSEAEIYKDSELRWFTARLCFDLASRSVQLLTTGEEGKIEIIAHLLARCRYASSNPLQSVFCIPVSSRERTQKSSLKEQSSKQSREVTRSLCANLVDTHERLGGRGGKPSESGRAEVAEATRNGFDWDEVGAASKTGHTCGDIMFHCV